MLVFAPGVPISQLRFELTWDGLSNELDLRFECRPRRSRERTEGSKELASHRNGSSQPAISIKTPDTAGSPPMTAGATIHHGNEFFIGDTCRRIGGINGINTLADRVCRTAER